MKNIWKEKQTQKQQIQKRPIKPGQWSLEQ